MARKAKARPLPRSVASELYRKGSVQGGNVAIEQAEEIRAEGHDGLAEMAADALRARLTEEVPVDCAVYVDSDEWRTGFIDGYVDKAQSVLCDGTKAT